MKFHKTALKERESYTYHFVDGQTVTLTPGRDGITELNIRELYSRDDSEVYYNIKNSRPMLTEKQKAEVKEWKDKHPGEEIHKNWTLSIEALEEEGIAQDKSSILATASYSSFEDVSDEVEHLREVVATFALDQKEIYYRVLLNEEPQVQVAAELGITKQALQSRLNKIKKKIKKAF